MTHLRGRIVKEIFDPVELEKGLKQGSKGCKETLGKRSSNVLRIGYVLYMLIQ